MLQEAMDESFGRERAQLELAGVRRAVAKSHLVVLQVDQAAVADRYSENIGSRYFRAVRPLPTGLQ